MFKNWEYWPSKMFYLPLIPYGFYLMLKSKSVGFFSATNPAITGSGNGLESKFKTIELLPTYCKPISIFIPENENFTTVVSKINEKQLKYPLIIKPDIGFRGLLVKKINSEVELLTYINKYNSINLILQEFIDFKNECGIFYHKLPNKTTGNITSLTLKKYLSVIGDGVSTVKTLIHSNERAKKYLKTILELNKSNLSIVPLKNEELVLNVIGNHSKGTQFINGNHLISKELILVLDKLNADIKGWNYGRLDIKYNSFEELLKGENFKVLEINGIIAEPTHMYDASKGSYFKALLEIKKHWELIYEIGNLNKQLNNASFTNFSYLITEYKKYKQYLKKVETLSTT